MRFIHVSLQKYIAELSEIILTIAQWARKFKKVQAKKIVLNQINQKLFFCEIAFFAFLKFFPVQKMIFGQF